MARHVTLTITARPCNNPIAEFSTDELHVILNKNPDGANMMFGLFGGLQKEPFSWDHYLVEVAVVRCTSDRVHRQIDPSAGRQ
jgi:hypothetical protein